MNTQMQLADGEFHQPLRQAALKARAIEIANDISKQPGIIAVLLSGSVARGPVGPSSDLDLHVIVSDSFSNELPVWRFGADGTIENLHKVSESQLSHGWSYINQTTDLSFWFYQTRLGDELNGYEPLFWDYSSDWKDRLPQLLAYRAYSDVISHLVRFHANDAWRILLRANKALEDNAIMDSHQGLRGAVQAAFVSALIRRGWIIRGSKKRIEISKSFIPDPFIEPILEIALDAVGLRTLSKERTNEICKARLGYRKTVQDELVSLKELYAQHSDISQRLILVIREEEQHNAHAFDYYLALIQQGFFLGPINHIRSLSGFSRVPSLFLSCLGVEFKWPIREFLSFSELSEFLRFEWLRIADLTTSKGLCSDWVARLSSIIREFLEDRIN